jgi:hypothetical protein
MTGIETVLTEVESVSRDLDRRTFLKYAAAVFLVPSGMLELEHDDERFFQAVTATLVPVDSLRQTGIDPVVNLRHLLERSSADHRRRIGRLIRGVRRVSFLYGGDHVALHGRASRFVLMQKASRALASLCLLCVWGDPRSFALVDDPARGASGART